MNSGFYGISGSARLSSKAGAMEFAIMMNTHPDASNSVTVDYKEAKKLFDFICRNVELPDLPHDSMESVYDTFKGVLENLAKENKCKDSQQKEA